ncbi:MAG: hypothetical protein EA365_11595 [Gloeocapsa sp. DLM2.Bin57]|nr:MAG: hypothetical protein EA365_11595 [Gloeocapsa sp. DLM2.Bin57]
MTDNKILIHIGYPKTASTWLQKTVFSNENLGFTPFSPFSKIENDPRGDMQALKYFVDQSDVDFNSELVYQELNSCIKQSNLLNMVYVLSNECFVFPIFKQGYYKMTADRIYQVFPNGKILCLIREQKAAIFSLYNQIIKLGINYSSTLEEFLGIKSGGRLNLGIDVSVYKYDQIIEYYQTKFGKNNVLFLPFEVFVKNKKECLIKIINFVEIDANIKEIEILANEKYINEKLKSGTIEIKRIMNRIFYQPYKIGKEQLIRRKIVTKLTPLVQNLIPERMHVQAEKRLKGIIEEYCQDMYKESNQKTSELIGYNLSDLGYDC